MLPIKTISGVELIASDRPGISKVMVKDPEARFDLSWDRFVRLKAAAEAIEKIADKGIKILDVGGYDGALGLFLLGYELDLIDPATTGASILDKALRANSYDVVSAIDALEHIRPEQREAALEELARVARKWVVLNYPCVESREAQQLVFKATNNPLIREHVEWDLPSTDWVLSVMQKLGFTGELTKHSSLAVWLGQYLTLNLAPEKAADLNRYLVEHHSAEPFSRPLYHLLVCSREA